MFANLAVGKFGLRALAQVILEFSKNFPRIS